jgi:PAS domain S-box-containing protein
MPAALLAALVYHSPAITIVLSIDGIVLHCNAAACHATGFSEKELLGKNFWALLFPGKLFAQVPRFMSATHPAQLVGKDVAMVMRTRDGKERVVAWTKVVHERGGQGDAKSRAIICFGTDLTDRLVDSDLGNKSAGPNGNRGAGDDNFVPFGPGVGNAGSVDYSDSEVITPIAISPPALAADGTACGAAIQQVHEFLTEIDKRMEQLTAAFTRGEFDGLAGIAGGLRDGARACGLLDFSARAEKLHVAATSGAIDHVAGLVEQIVNMCRPGKQPGT